jgi:hypothetical protein
MVLLLPEPYEPGINCGTAFSVVVGGVDLLDCVTVVNDGSETTPRTLPSRATTNNEKNGAIFDFS